MYRKEGIKKEFIVPPLRDDDDSHFKKYPSTFFLVVHVNTPI